MQNHTAIVVRRLEHVSADRCRWYCGTAAADVTQPSDETASNAAVPAQCKMSHIVKIKCK